MIPDRGRQLIKLLPGDYYAGRQDVVIETILGSCISVCLFSPEQRMGAINHALLPASPGAPRDLEIGRYVDSSLEHLIACFVRQGVLPSALCAILIGGANMFPYPVAGASCYNVGALNIERALEVLAGHGIRVCSRITGGGRGRKIRYYPRTGQLYMQEVVTAGRGKMRRGPERRGERRG